MVAVTCHDDCAAWLEADWVMRVEPAHVTITVYGTAGERPAGVEAMPGIAYKPRGCLRRPDLVVDVVRLTRPEAGRVWPLFKPHHYLSGELARPALSHLGLVRVDPGERDGRDSGEVERRDVVERSIAELEAAEGQEEGPGLASGVPAAFVAVLPFRHPKRPGWREHRCVCLPDFQGVGIGNAVSEHVARQFRAATPEKAYFSTTSHPGMIAHRRRSRLWRMARKPGLAGGHHGTGGGVTAKKHSATDRITAGFEFVG
jgi:hypothetical protein